MRVEHLSSHRGAKADICANDVIGALRKLGGEAHRDLVVARVLSDARDIAPGDRARIAIRVDQVLSEAEKVEGDGVWLRRVYGPGSNRWKLASHPAELIRLEERRAAR